MMKFESVGYISNLSPSHAYTVDNRYINKSYDSEALADDDLRYINENAGFNDSVQSLSVTSAKVYAFKPTIKEEDKSEQGTANRDASSEVEQTEFELGSNQAKDETQLDLPNVSNPDAEVEADNDDINLDKEDLVLVEADDLASDDDYDAYDDQEENEIVSLDDYGFVDYVDIDETPDREEILKETLLKQKLSRTERAHQIAVEILAQYDWSRAQLPMLHEIFIERGWAMARVSIEREINKGLTPDELKIAFYIRQLWTESTHYWISFIHVNNNAMHQQTRAAYKNMSWPEALRIIRSFYNTPSEEEVQYLLEELYDDWYGSKKHRQEFKTFIRYLKYRTGSVKGTLAAKELFTFKDDFEQDFYLDTSHCFYEVNNTFSVDYIDFDQILINCDQYFGDY